ARPWLRHHTDVAGGDLEQRRDDRAQRGHGPDQAPPGGAGPGEHGRGPGRRGGGDPPGPGEAPAELWQRGRDPGRRPGPGHRGGPLRTASGPAFDGPEPAARPRTERAVTTELPESAVSLPAEALTRLREL